MSKPFVLFLDRPRELLSANGWAWLTAGRYQSQAKHYERINVQCCASDIESTWDNLLLEAVYNALGETDPMLQQINLAVAQSVLSAISRDLLRKKAEVTA